MTDYTPDCLSSNATKALLGNGVRKFEIETRRWKTGDGVTRWPDLPYDDIAEAEVMSAIAVASFPVTASITYNSDGSVANVTENGVTTTYTYNSDGTVHTDTRLGVTRTYTYDGSGNLTGIAS